MASFDFKLKYLQDKIYMHALNTYLAILAISIICHIQNLDNDGMYVTNILQKSGYFQLLYLNVSHIPLRSINVTYS